ncbi:unnamed protein product [Nippostrongylus brasiliensis]|uniref:Mediator of RNA polymerase II transcription subunit 23 n=1 Tax=Nippostrongylus brasiliensis TaxID=27835 RepID=A0A0N4Y9Y1_NIPBR|nr:unnamed protein product [Nippostrongylus brasiliensis]
MMSAAAGQPTEAQDDKEKSLVVREGDGAPERPLDIERLRRCIIEFVKEKNVLLTELVTIVHESSLQWRQDYERVVDSILYYAHAAGRLAHRLSELIMYFRAVAELSYVIGRCFLFPLPAHPSFAASAASCRIDHLTTQISHRAPYLPYKAELKAPQTYLLYTVIRQPRGKEVLSGLLRQVSHGRTQWDEILSVLISETMAEVQKLPEDVEIPRYQWENLMSIIMYGITQKHINLSRLLSLLSNVLVKTGYRRARDEVMWIMLQIAGTFQQHLQKEQVEEMARLYNLLFNDDVVWTGASDHPSQLVRFLAAACMWNILDGSEGLPPPSECLANQIEFVRSNTGPPDEAMQAVLDNAFRHESPISRNVHAIFQQRLDGQPTDEPHLLPYGRPANNKLDAFDMQFLDALTLRAKINLLLSTCFVSLHKVDRLPSPACVETCARILTSIEFDYGLTNFITILNRSITAALTPPPQDSLSLKDQCYMLLDLLCYRLPSIPMNFRASISHAHDPSPAGLRLCMTIHSAMAQPQIASNYGLYSAMEHTLMRQWAWNLLPDTISLAHLFVDNAFGNTLLNLNSWLVSNPMDNTRAGRLVVCPEIVRMLLITMMRAMKIMGIESDPELMRINQVYTWAPSQLSSLPLTAQRTAITPEEDIARAEAFQREVHTDFTQMRGQPEMSWMEYMSMPSRQPTILCVIFRHLIDSLPEHSMLAPVVYQILDRLTCREYVLAALLNCSEINERIDFYCRYIPKRDVDAPEHFRRLSEYHRKFPEMTFSEMANRPPMMAEMINPRAHYPIYYGSLIERLLPILDFTLARALELQVDNIFSTILTTCGPIYKFHPYPITFLYTILFCMHEQVGHHPRARQFVLAILCQAPDWRFAEYPPAAQALYLACIELLASPHTPEHIVPAMINLLVSSRAQPPRPYLMLNAIALLLTALPEAYCRVLQNEFLAVIDSGVLASMTFEEIVFDEFEERQLLQMASRPLIVNVVAQAYWYHSNLTSLSKLISTFAGEVCSRANTENDLWYALRLVVPLLQRCYDWREKVKHEESLKVVSVLYTKIGDITERYGDIVHGDELCDLLYYFKYMFVGDFLRKEAEAAFPRFPPRMRERLKFYTSFSSNKEKDEECAAKMSSVSRPDLGKLLKARSSERAGATDTSGSSDH